MPTPIVKDKIIQAKALYSKYERYTPAIFFAIGFLFDVFTLDRIDSVLIMAQQGSYLLLLLIMISHYFIEIEQNRPLSEAWRFYTQWRIPALHFLFGSLLSSFTLFYFMSASVSASFLFLLFLTTLLLVNEFPRFQSLGLSFKFALLTLCLVSYFSYLVPIVFGFMGTGVFLISLFIGVTPIWILSQILARKNIHPAKIRVQVLRPAGFIIVAFLLAYLLRLIPPVPLSIQYMGVYHDVKKNDVGQYLLSHERPWWRFWHSGDQWFEAQPGDKVLVFFRIFSPARFNDTVRLVWYMQDDKRGWLKQDSIPIKITGGRDEGFRGYGVKSNYTEGKWRAMVETLDGREIGRIQFFLSLTQAKPREFKTDYQ